MSKIKSSKLLIFFVLLLIIVSAYYFISKRGKGGWICRDGAWVTQGKPSKPRPLYPCDDKNNKKEGIDENEDYNEGELDETEIIEIQNQDDNLAEKEIVGDNIRVNALGVGDIIKPPLKITGSAKGWYFEGSFGVQVVGENGEVLYAGVAEAQEDWMQDKYVPFEVELNFETKGLEKGIMIFRKNNPSGLEENNQELRFLILFR